MGLPPPESAAPVASSSKPKPAAPPKPADPYANYTTAASLGIRDEAAERAAAEAERRQNEGVIGEWQKVVKPRAPAPPSLDAGGDKGKRRAADELGGFRGEAVLRPGVGANGVKREEGDDAADRKPQVGATDDSEDIKPSQTAARPLGEREDDDDSTLETAKKRGFLSEKSALNDDDDDPLSNLAPIKLKKRRLTVKEQQAEEDKRLAKEREVEEVLRARAARDGQRGAWESVDPMGDEEAEYDPFAGTGAEGGQDKADGAAKEEGDPPVEQAAPAPEEVKPQPTALFKKKKRPGGGGLKAK